MAKDCRNAVQPLTISAHPCKRQSNLQSPAEFSRNSDTGVDPDDNQHDVARSITRSLADIWQIRARKRNSSQATATPTSPWPMPPPLDKRPSRHYQAPRVETSNPYSALAPNRKSKKRGHYQQHPALCLTRKEQDCREPFSTPAPCPKSKAQDCRNYLDLLLDKPFSTPALCLTRKAQDCAPC